MRPLALTTYPSPTNKISVLNGLTVRYFGMSEFYMSIFKAFLMVGLVM